MRIRTHTNPLSCIKRFQKLDPIKLFAKFENKLDLEIGFGQSNFIFKYSYENSRRFVVGVELRRKAVAIMQQRLKTIKLLDNVYLVQGNGFFCLQDMFDDNSIDRVFIFHPDPWIKKHHQKRRLVNFKFLDVLSKKLKQGGRVYITTDIEFLWRDILRVFTLNNSFIQVEEINFWQKYYEGRWDEICKNKKRKIFFATFCLRN
ncbi:hypothetical protein GF322_03570 [Candidatus Dependentiae bacterium]|nr:hypothetical protein [Candidatus Dependentiae bacterium]